MAGLGREKAGSPCAPYLNPECGMPTACRTYTMSWMKKMKKKTKKLNELSLLEEKAQVRVCCPQEPPPLPPRHGAPSSS